MIYIFLVYFLLIILINKIRFNEIIRINTFLTGSWCISISLSSLKIFGFYSISYSVYFYSFLFLNIYNFIYYISFIDYKNVLKKKSVDIKDIRINLKLLLILNIICWLFCLPTLFKTMGIIRAYGFATLRGYYYNSSIGLASVKTLLIFEHFIYPVFNASILISAYAILEKRNLKIVLVGMLDALIYLFISAGRAYLLNFIQYIVIAILIGRSGYLIYFLKKRKKMIFILIIFVIGIVYISLKRSVSSLNLIQNYLFYLSGSFVFLSELLKTGSVPIASTYGKAMFGCIYDPFVLALKLLGFNLETIGEVISNVTASSRYISSLYQFNAAPTSLFTFLIDFGWAGIILGGMIFSLLSAKIEMYYLKHNSLFSKCLYIYIVLLNISSTGSYPFGYSRTLFHIFFIFILTYEKMGHKRRLVTNINQFHYNRL